MPKDPGIIVLVQCNGRARNICFSDAIELASFIPSEGWMLDDFPDADISIDAWMPLPEPYKGEEK